jgi:alkylated DNA nucleotide flippase Atl1
MDTTDALAKFFATLSTAAAELAADLREHPELEDVPEETDPTAGLGPRQREIYAILQEAGDGGIVTSEIAKRMGGYDVPNAYLALRRLESLGLAELVPGAKPQRWRLRERARGNAGPYLLAAQQVGPGEWATYGDIAIAVKGSDNAARAVGRAAATLPNFPNPHRVLRARGIIPKDWHDDAGQGPEECRRRLDVEGVTFTAQGHADPAKRVSWEQLRERLREAGVPVPAGPEA